MNEEEIINESRNVRISSKLVYNVTKAARHAVRVFKRAEKSQKRQRGCSAECKLSLKGVNNGTLPRTCYMLHVLDVCGK